MRLTPDQAEAVRRRIRSQLGQQSRIWLFGSRVDDQRRGGDVNAIKLLDYPPSSATAPDPAHRDTENSISAGWRQTLD